VAINGQPVLSNFDILAQAPPKTALDKAFVVNVTGGQLTVELTGTRDNAQVNALQVGAGGAVPPAPTVTAISPAAGPTTGGAAVTISGANFGGATRVAFGGKPATAFTVTSAGSITATAPAGAAGTVDVTVTTVGGTSVASAADRFTYVAPPTITKVNPKSG